MKNPFTLVSSDVKYSNPWISLREDKVVRPSGETGLFGVVTMVPGSTVLPMFDDHTILLAREYKYAVNRESIEIVSGAIESGESALDAAKRELKEEAGAVSEEWHELGVLDPFPTVIHSPIYLFLARNIQTAGIFQRDEGEVIELDQVPFDQAVDMVMSSKITHAASCTAILKTAIFIGYPTKKTRQ